MLLRSNSHVRSFREAGVLSGEVGYLTEKDQTSFDKEVDRYLNADYYNYPKKASAKTSIVNKITSAHAFLYC